MEAPRLKGDEAVSRPDGDVCSGDATGRLKRAGIGNRHGLGDVGLIHAASQGVGELLTHRRNRQGQLDKVPAVSQPEKVQVVPLCLGFRHSERPGAVHAGAVCPGSQDRELQAGVARISITGANQLQRLYVDPVIDLLILDMQRGEYDGEWFLRQRQTIALASE